jgi:uracil-DNA glycosylase
VHESGVPFDDASGERLRDWLGLDRDAFYDPRKVAILPMGFCFPGTGQSGDLPPRPECAPLWRQRLLDVLTNIRLTLLVGRYAQRWHLGSHAVQSVTQTVAAWRDWWPQGLVPMPHPSPRNRIWLRRNPWFEAELIPRLRERVRALIESGPIG